MLIIGHRGARGLAPENTLASFEAGLHAGVDGVEFDVRSTKDNRLVITHDPKLGNLTVKSSKFSDLKKIHPNLLLFKELADFLLGKTKIYIEVKSGTDTTLFISELKKILQSGWDIEDIFVLSFSQEILLAVQDALPNIRLMVNEPWSSILARRRAAELDTHYIDLNHTSLWPGFIKLMSRSGYHLACYPLNDPKKAARWGKAGLNTVITDFPDRFQSLRN